LHCINSGINSATDVGGTEVVPAPVAHCSNPGTGGALGDK